MTDYVPVSEACVKAGITRHALDKLIHDGKVRVQDTCDSAKSGRPQVRFVAYQDIIDVQAGLALSYIDLCEVGQKYGIAPRAVRYQIQNHRLRWRRAGTHLQPCATDLDMFVKGAERQSNTKPIVRRAESRA